jgi:hypothetical protein
MPKATFKKFISLSAREKLSILFAQPIIIALMPRTFFRLYKNVLKKNDDSATGFSPLTSVILTYYMRIAELVKRYGSRGYFSETALGFSAKERFWLNPISLVAFNELKIRKFCILSACVFIFSISLVGIIEQNAWTILILFFMIPSSLFLLPFFRVVKPELLSWAFFPLAFYFFLKDYYVLSALVMLLISFLNFTVSLFAIESVLVFSVLSFNLGFGAITVFPAGLNLLISFVPFATSPFVKGLLEVLGGKKSKSRKEKFLGIRPNDLMLGFFYFLFALTFISDTAYFLFLFSALILFYINQALFRFADNHSFFRLFLILSTIFVIIGFNAYSFTAYLLLIYISSVGLFESIEDIIKEYPHLKQYSVEEAGLTAERFFSKVQNQARIAFEVENTEKDLAGFRGVFTHFEYILCKREIGLLPGEYLRLTQLDYYMKEYTKLNAKSSEETVKQKLEELGAEYVLVYSEEFAGVLKKWGYQKLAEISKEDLEKNYPGLELPGKGLYLFKSPFRNSFIVPEAPLIRRPNLIKFKAEAGNGYIVKYNYHPAWKAFLNKKRIKISRAQGGLSYIYIKAQEQGEVELIFS